MSIANHIRERYHTSVWSWNCFRKKVGADWASGWIFCGANFRGSIYENQRTPDLGVLCRSRHRRGCAARPFMRRHCLGSCARPWLSASCFGFRRPKPLRRRSCVPFWKARCVRAFFAGALNALDASRRPPCGRGVGSLRQKKAARIFFGFMSTRRTLSGLSCACIGQDQGLLR